ncbi:MAG: DUF5694 domain-containing protein [Hyphomonas sp.]
MKRQIFAAGIALALSTLGAAAAEPAQPETEPVRVLVLGTYHFDNPGLDLVNAEADDVLTDTRQAELQDLADRLAAFQPNAIAIESVRRGDDFLDQRFAAFTPEHLVTDRNEIVQIGYRAAHQLGVSRVYAVDEQEGEVAFFPFNRVRTYVERTGNPEIIDTMIARVKADSDMLMREQETTPITELLARQNEPSLIERMHADYYYALLPLADAEDQAGAALNYGWYARNALIFANIAANAQPGDRILVIYGAGHNYWLRHFVEQTPGFELVDPLGYLRD